MERLGTDRDTYDANIIPGETVARKEREGDDYKKIPEGNLEGGAAIDTCSDDFHDLGNADFLTGQMEQHESMAWMLRSFIEGDAIHPNGQIPSAAAVGIPAGV